MQTLAVADRDPASGRVLSLIMHGMLATPRLEPSPDSTWLATLMYLRPASLARITTASASGISPRTLASLISIGRLMPAITSTFGLVHHRDGQIGRRAAEHVGQHDHAVARIGAVDGLDDLPAAHGDIVLGADRNGLQLLLRPDHVLERRAEFLRQPAVRDDDNADHELEPISSLARSTAERGPDRGDR